MNVWDSKRTNTGQCIQHETTRGGRDEEKEINNEIHK